MAGEFYDVVGVGGGPAGLSAAVTLESEGRQVGLIEACGHPGGQIGTSSRVENYLGFPDGISGPDLADRAKRQACRFTTELLLNTRAQEIRQIEDGFEVVGTSPEGLLIARGRTVLVTAGVEYRELDVPNIDKYLHHGVRYGSPCMTDDFSDQEIYVVGGANSAGQAVSHLSKYENCNVHLVVRGPDITDKMSAYLCDRIEATPNIEVHTETEVIAVDGDEELREAVLAGPDGEQTVSLNGLYIMIGAKPKVDWLPDQIIRDKHGFIVAGNIEEEARQAFIEICGRPPLPHETTMPGVFAAGDVRSGTIKRVASAVGDGATTAPDLHQYFAAQEGAC